MSKKISIKVDIFPPDRDHCKLQLSYCQRLEWHPDYVCGEFHIPLFKSDDGTIKRPKFCRDREVSDETK